MKILCTGDLHLGRRSSRLPKHLDGRANSSAACWERIVELAILERVDVVVLSGDLVDRANRFFEAVGPLEAGLRRLAGEGITTVAVAGNHDYDVLPRLADTLAGDELDDPDATGPGPEQADTQGAGTFRLLGRGGEWERMTIQRGGRVLHLDGWSFPEPSIHESPVASYSLPAPDDGAVLGLLHADLDQTRSPYAPVMLAELRAARVDFWLLGHIHAPALHAGDGHTPVLYPGSPQALDPGETGAHGVWLLELTAGQRFEERFIPLSTVRYDEVVIDLTGAGDLEEVEMRVVEEVRARLVSLEDDDALRCLSCRLRVVGRTPVHRHLDTHLNAFARDLEPEAGSTTAVIERIEVETRPARDLTRLAQGRDPVGVLAGLLVALEGAKGTAGVPSVSDLSSAPATPTVAERAPVLGAEHERLIRAAHRAARDVGRARAYLGLDDSRPGERSSANHAPGTAESADAPATVYHALEHQASLLLDLLLAQKEEG